MENTLGYELSNGGSIPSGRTINNIMKSSCYRSLNFDFSYLKSNFNLEEVTEFGSKFKSEDILSPQLLNFLDEIELSVPHVQVWFYPTTVKESSIHIDHHYAYDEVNLNFVHNGQGSTVNWYSPQDSYQGYLSANKYGIVRRYNIDKLFLLNSAELTGPCLFQSGIPHNVSKVPEINRWCVTAAIRKNNKFLLWKDAMVLFRRYIAES